MARKVQKGFTLVELLTAVALAAVTGLVVLQVLSNYQASKRVATGRNDAQISASLGLYVLQKEIRMAGSGFTLPGGSACRNGIDIAYNGVAISNGDPVRPVRIVDGGASAPDRIDILRGNSGFGPAPATILQTMAAPTARIVVDSDLELGAGNLILVAGYDGNKICTLMQLSGPPTVDGNAWELLHASGSATPFNPASPTALFTSAPTYDVRDLVINLGTYGWRRFSVVCSDGGVPAASNNCDLASYDLLGTAQTPSLSGVQSESAQIVDLQAQYGITPGGQQAVDAWVDATGDWAAPSLTNQSRIRAVRLALVARGARDNGSVAPASLTLWDDGPSNRKVRNLSTEERQYRYQVLTVVVPIVNSIWAGT